jgi:two-component system sensor histidine kinase PilS (NtrC family)
LIGNARRHSRKGDRSILVHAAATADQLVELHVVDDGAGVTDDHAGKLFEPFFTTDARGTGLGLYIARELAEANRAALDFVPAGDLKPGGAALPGADFRLMMEGHGKPA